MIPPELFPNGFGISVIQERHAGDVPLYEIAVLRHKNGKHARVCYDSGITDDVIRFLPEDVVYSLRDKIRSLPLETRTIQ